VVVVHKDMLQQIVHKAKNQREENQVHLSEEVERAINMKEAVGDLKSLIRNTNQGMRLEFDIIGQLIV
jgi:hypothetical protein